MTTCSLCFHVSLRKEYQFIETTADTSGNNNINHLFGTVTTPPPGLYISGILSASLRSQLIDDTSLVLKKHKDGQRWAFLRLLDSILYFFGVSVPHETGFQLFISDSLCRLFVHRSKTKFQKGLHIQSTFLP